MFNTKLVRTSLLLSLVAGLPAFAQPDGSDTAPTPVTAGAASKDAHYAFGNERIHNNEEVWEGNPGFLNGLRGFECAVEPVGQPLYFESPYNVSGLRFLYLHHEFSDGSQLQASSRTRKAGTTSPRASSTCSTSTAKPTSSPPLAPA
jgi:hypothetical protein